MLAIGAMLAGCSAVLGIDDLHPPTIHGFLRFLRAEGFEAAYAARSGVTVEWLHAHGRWPEPCDCGEGMCEGWEMGHQWEDALLEDELRKSGLRPWW